MPKRTLRTPVVGPRPERGRSKCHGTPKEPMSERRKEAQSARRLRTDAFGFRKDHRRSASTFRGHPLLAEPYRLRLAGAPRTSSLCARARRPSTSGTLQAGRFSKFVWPKLVWIFLYGVLSNHRFMREKCEPSTIWRKNSTCYWGPHQVKRIYSWLSWLRYSVSTGQGRGSVRMIPYSVPIIRIIILSFIYKREFILNKLMNYFWKIICFRPVNKRRPFWDTLYNTHVHFVCYACFFQYFARPVHYK